MLTPRIIKVLIIDDDEDDYFIIANYINSIQANKFTIDLCRSFETGMEKMRARQYDIYFVDYRLGKHTGLELLQQIHSEEFYDPIVLLTGKGNKAVDIQAMMSGATDYLIKSELNTEKLERCIRYSLDRTRSLKEIRARENRYRNLFEGSKDALFIANDQLVMAEVNEAAAALLASPKTELVTQSLYDYIIEEAQKEQLRALIQQNANINDLAVDIRDRGDEIKSCLLSVSLLESPDGSYLLHGIIHDITNIKKVEVANLQAQKLAANERLMRILAHEIRNPLNNISLSIDHFELPYNDTEMQKSLI